MKFIGILGASMGGAIILGTVSGGVLATKGFFVVCIASASFDAFNVLFTFFFLREPKEHQVETESINYRQIFTLITSQVLLYHFSLSEITSDFICSWIPVQLCVCNTSIFLYGLCSWKVQNDTSFSR